LVEYTSLKVIDCANSRSEGDFKLCMAHPKTLMLPVCPRFAESLPIDWQEAGFLLGMQLVVRCAYSSQQVQFRASKRHRCEAGQLCAS
jgi:hypothetical protein